MPACSAEFTLPYTTDDSKKIGKLESQSLSQISTVTEVDGAKKVKSQIVNSVTFCHEMNPKTESCGAWGFRRLFY
jgi:hypothetical protein